MTFARIKGFFTKEFDAVAVMRAFAYLLIIAGVVMSVGAAYQQYRGVATEPSFDEVGPPGDVVIRERNPEHFRGIVQLNWFHAGATLFLGILLHSIIRAQDRSDPFAPDADRKQQD